MTTNVYEIGLIPSKNQKLSVSLKGISYNLMFKWLDAPMGGWVIDIADENDVPIIGGIPMVTGTDLLSPFAYKGVGGALIVQTDHNADAVPTYNNLGIESHLYFIMVS